MPSPIRKVRDQFGPAEEVAKQGQDLSSFLPLLKNPYSLLQQIVSADQDREKIKSIWISSEANDDKTMIVSASTPKKDVREMQSKGLIEVLDEESGHISLTDRGSKLLNEAVLNSGSSFTKSASKNMVLKNSYDFGDEVLVKVNHPEKFGARYVSVSKKKFANRKAQPRVVDSYDIQTKKACGAYKEISEYTDEELIKVLHLSKKIIDNEHEIVVANNFEHPIPVHKIKAFSEMIVKELNKR